jgi:hypothetical protein
MAAHRRLSDLGRSLLRILAGRIRRNQDARWTNEAPALHRAERDDGRLTGLRNRRWLDDAFARTIERSPNAADLDTHYRRDHFGALRYMARSWLTRCFVAPPVLTATPARRIARAVQHRNSPSSSGP